ncbi:hypothetical protein EDC39_10639 [Geothermobacter ehrlichii]|uniref:Uncharacterized protein n=1 Tax=Geothermobacter ehrlichii TaxID=213224 RepID=A0A5D3WIX4_9BACT|nr:hypothetical protein EDC39_10639 [Geothermobacter ehrlichii]
MRFNPAFVLMGEKRLGYLISPANLPFDVCPINILLFCGLLLDQAATIMNRAPFEYSLEDKWFHKAHKPYNLLALTKQFCHPTLQLRLPGTHLHKFGTCYTCYDQHSRYAVTYNPPPFKNTNSYFVEAKKHSCSLLSHSLINKIEGLEAHLCYNNFAKSTLKTRSSKPWHIAALFFLKVYEFFRDMNFRPLPTSITWGRDSARSHVGHSLSPY